MLAPLYRLLLRPLLFRMDAERAHELAMRALTAFSGNGALRALLSAMVGRADTPGLAREVFGVSFPNPIGLAAGFDKNGVALRAWEALGFGFVEAGTITARAQPGNERPRLFRFPEQRALVNRLGFNNRGADLLAAHFYELRAAKRWPSIPVGINIGKSKITPLDQAVEDYLHSFGRLHAYADYMVVNVSSPNTPGLRQLQGREELSALLGALQAANRALAKPRPLLVKIAPDLTDGQIANVAALADEHALAGIVATNTTIDHSALPEDRRGETGGLSGAPLRARATQVVRFLASHTSMPIVAVGGVDDAASAREKLDAGASLVQLYTGFVYGGPALVRDLVAALGRLG
ncbi:dihydroorotate dehydrogenase [Verrucomicrobia bacterium SCGC AG-212-E04]|nr:dihydroorotate dehydrogenase [Verrucomicrobia bacterium SCGC AG-212-E04]